MHIRHLSIEYKESIKQIIVDAFTVDTSTRAVV